MTEALRVPGEALAPIKAFLLQQLPMRDEPSRSATVGLKLPDDWNTSAAAAVVLYDDSGPLLWPVATESQVRVTVWANGRDNARTIAKIALGLLLTSRVDGIARLKPSTNLIDGRDERTGGLLASFTVKTTVRTQLI